MTGREAREEGWEEGEGEGCLRWRCTAKLAVAAAAAEQATTERAEKRAIAGWKEGRGGDRCGFRMRGRQA